MLRLTAERMLGREWRRKGKIRKRKKFTSPSLEKKCLWLILAEGYQFDVEGVRMFSHMV